MENVFSVASISDVLLWALPSAFILALAAIWVILAVRHFRKKKEEGPDQE
ncbi:MAG: hypothetical protein IK088_00010 [Lachnospiraceae bacterium]|nr:hypothetical protein [Lachnospiraceae bacterium]